MPNGLPSSTGSSFSVGQCLPAIEITPSLRLHYRGLFATTGDSAPRNRPWYFCPCGCYRLSVSRFLLDSILRSPLRSASITEVSSLLQVIPPLAIALGTFALAVVTA